MKQCTYCGKECPDTEARCPIDGEPLKVVVPQPPNPGVPSGPVRSVQPEPLFFPHEIGRVSFLVRYAILLLAVFLGALLLVTGARLKPGIPALLIVLLSIVVLGFSLFYFVRYALVARLRDIGISTLFGLLIFIPVVNLAFILVLLVAPRDGFGRSTPDVI